MRVNFGSIKFFLSLLRKLRSLIKIYGEMKTKGVKVFIRIGMEKESFGVNEMRRKEGEIREAGGGWPTFVSC